MVTSLHLVQASFSWSLPIFLESANFSAVWAGKKHAWHHFTKSQFRNKTAVENRLVALCFFQQLCNLSPLYYSTSSFLSLCLAKQMPWQCIVNRKQFERCLYENTTLLQSGCSQKWEFKIPFVFLSQKGIRVKRFCFHSHMPKIRCLDKTPLV